MSIKIPALATLTILGMLTGTVLTASAAEQDKHAPEADLRFAEDLFAQRDYYRAITEYKRFLFQNPDSPRVPWVRFRIGQSYLVGGKLSAARYEFESLEAGAEDPKVRLWAGLSVARTLYLDDRLRQSEEAIKGWLEGVTDPGLRGYGLYLAACAHLKSGQVQVSRTRFLSLWADHPLADRAAWLATELARVEDLPYKSPIAAGLLSLVPGLGHLYLGETSVAVTAFVWNGMFGFATYDAFSRGHHGVGTLLAALTLLWYSGTIYGAISGAHRYNRDARLNFLEDLDRGSGLDLAYPDHALVGGYLLSGEF